MGCIDSKTKETNNLIIGDRIDGPANVRDTINGKKILFSLNDNLIVECTEAVNDWQMIGYYIKLDSIQYETFKLEPEDTLFDIDGNKIGITKSEVDVWMGNENNGVSYGLIVGYTHKQNIKPESVIENVLARLINDSEKIITLDNLKPLIKSFQLETCSSNSMGDENGKWYFKWDNSIDDPSPQDRITLIIENNELIGIVHIRKIHFKNYKTYDLIRGHKFTPVRRLSQVKINELIKERINWYNSVD
ncbi:MAG: hypothetical protein RQ875_13020 [Vicingaceae bacterium]|nr:hypothetical protein [Vicingaceae bacterium]